MAILGWRLFVLTMKLFWTASVWSFELMVTAGHSAVSLAKQAQERRTNSSTTAILEDGDRLVEVEMRPHDGEMMKLACQIR